MHEIFYRLLGPDDLGEYRRIRINCLEQYPNNFGTTSQEERNSEVLKLDNSISQPDSYNFTIGAFNTDKTLIGICGFLAETRQKTKHRGEVVQMFVDPNYKGQGVGQILLQKTIDKAFSSELIEQIILSAVFENEKAVKLYKRAGFVEYGRLQNYFKSATVYTTQSFFVLNKPGIR
ncbi:N-acetyltransferase [Panacibacter ginsenosidivorans]|uniref:N-acetyltransferase n=1 Tax=Panacibacter ginsenosidivorans TaxID=1813871 RepID=A0A5B8VBT3_9BACT|nr:GNAT family N-acetyltransferase [Panacibacter ginsenosidivorans]QEC68970.1 N-acetyltransferase [Panacibacter ginsenosidivorans]